MVANYYDMLGIKADVPQEAIKRSLDAYRMRLMQMGEWEAAKNEFRHIEETLCDWDSRKAYNVKHKIPLPGVAYTKMTTPKAKAPPVEVKKKKKSALRSSEVLIPVFVVSILILALYWGFFFWNQFRPYPEGVYLIDRQSGDVVSLILDKEENYPFEAGAEARLEIVMIKTGKHLLVAESQVRPTMRPGKPVPTDILAKEEKYRIR